MIKFLLICLTLATVNPASSQDVLFPKEKEPTHLSGNNPVITERIPVYIPMRCGENMFLYPGSGDKSSWTCDCQPGYLYFPSNNTCYEAYRQGPCSIGHYVILPEDTVVPKCVENPCATDGYVSYNGVCQELETFGGVCKNGYLSVDTNTFRLYCAEMPQFSFNFINVPKIECPPGTRKVSSGDCRKVLK